MVMMFVGFVACVGAVRATTPQWQVVSTASKPVIGSDKALTHGIHQGFETGFYFKVNDTYYYSATELGLCKGIVWDHTTRAGLWSAKNSTGPWHRVATLRNTESMYTICKDEAGKGKKNAVAWATTLIFAQSGVNGSTPVWNLFYSADEAGRFQPGDGIVHAVSTTDNIAGPYVDLPGTFVPGTGVVVPDTHAFAAWKLRNGSWVGFRNNVPGMEDTFSVGLIAATGDGGRTVGGTWRYSDNNSVPFRFGPENPQVSASTDGRWYYSVYDALEQPPQGGVENDQSNHQPNHQSSHHLCTSKTQCDSIGIAWSMDGITWTANASDTLRVQLHDNHPCGQIRTALGIVGEPHLCRGCYSVLWTGFSNQSNSMLHGPGFEPVCQAIIRNVNE